MSADPQVSQSNLDNPVEIVISRVFTAPRELVWRAWTDPSQVGSWWGPAGFTTTTHEMDFRPGGAWRYTMHGPEGTDYKNKIVYLEIDRPARLVYKHSGEEEFEPVNFRTEVAFNEADGGQRTHVVMRSIFPNAEARDFVINNYGAVEGGKQHLANLEDHLGRMVVGDSEPPFTMSRVFRASREQVWQAWTDRDQLIKWFGPKGMTMKHATLDLRVGGLFHYCMTHPNGMEMWGRWVFRTINRPDQLEFVSSFSNAQAEIVAPPFPGLEDFPLEIFSTVNFIDHAGVGKGTLVTMEARPLDGTKAQREFFTNFHPSMQGGWTGTFDQLAEFLASA